jgi:Holliday junction resolvase
MSNTHPTYLTARQQLTSFLENLGFKVHPKEVYCPAANHSWVDVAAAKGQDFWAFEYKSRNDSIRRGLSQCQAYATAFNYVVLVANRTRATSSPYFGKFKRNGFGVWSHVGSLFHPILKPQRRTVTIERRSVIERQFRWTMRKNDNRINRKISDWFPS